MVVKDISITSLETITAFDLVSGNYKFTLDELQNATISQTQETLDITGKGGRKINRIKRNKAVTISGASGIVSGGLLELQTGSEFRNGVTKVMWTDYITVGEGNTAYTAYKAVGTVGAEIKNLFIRNADGTRGTELIQANEAASGKFAYNNSTKELTFHTDITKGTEIVAYYERQITADVLDNESDIFSGKAILYVDALGEDKCGNVYRVQFYIPKADFSGEFSFEMGDNQTVQNFEAEALAGACGVGGMLWTYTIFGVDAEDATAAAKLSSIAVTSPPTKTSYSVGDTFEPAGMVVTATMDDLSVKVINAGAYTYAPNGELTANDTTITISYTEGGVTKTATQAITVS